MTPELRQLLIDLREFVSEMEIANIHGADLNIPSDLLERVQDALGEEQ